MLAHTVIICNHPYFVIDEGFSRCLVWKWLLFLDWCREWFFFVIIFCSYCSTPFLPSPDQTPVQLFCSNFFPLLFNTTVHLLPSPAQHLFFPLLIKPWSTTSSIYCVTTSSLSCSTLLITFFPLLFNSPVSPSSLSCSTPFFPSPDQTLVNNFFPLLFNTSSLSCSILLFTFFPLLFTFFPLLLNTFFPHLLETLFNNFFPHLIKPMFNNIFPLLFNTSFPLLFNSPIQQLLPSPTTPSSLTCSNPYTPEGCLEVFSIPHWIPTFKLTLFYTLHESQTLSLNSELPKP